MANFRITPWKETSQLVLVRDQLYPKPSDIQDNRAKACSLVWVWKVRGNLPHAVEATALLTDAILHDDPSVNSIFSIRAAYSLAFCRFVTGLVDSKLHGPKQSMYQKAMAVGVPASFVELRHEATHRDLPSLVALRNAAQRSLEWLWEFYWATIEDSGGYVPELPDNAGFEDLNNETITTLRDTALTILRPFIDSIGNHMKSDQTSAKDWPLLDIAHCVRNIGAFCRKSSAAETILAQVLLDPDLDILVSSVRKRDDKDENELLVYFAAWDKVVKEACQSYWPFVTTLTEEMVAILISADIRDSEKTRHIKKDQILTSLNDDFYEETIFSWLEHILTSEIWTEVRSRYLVWSHLHASCGVSGTSSRFWAKRVHDLLSYQLYEHEITQTKPGSTSDKMEVDDTVKSHASPDSRSEEDSDIAVLRGYGWDFGQNILFRPIGSTSQA